jgi:uncharacterized membrane protein HdeD (DUF308 family)
MSNLHSEAQGDWWKLILNGVLTAAFGVAAFVFPAAIMFRRILDVVLGQAKPLSAGMTVVAALLALVALVAIDGLVNLFGKGVMPKYVTRLRGVVGVAVAIAAVFWPGMTIYFAVKLIGGWAVLVGVLELVYARHSGRNKEDRVLFIISGVAAIVLGVGMMIWVFEGAVLVSAVVGVAAIARGFSLIMSGVRQRASESGRNGRRTTERRAA